MEKKFKTLRRYSGGTKIVPAEKEFNLSSKRIKKTRSYMRGAYFVYEEEDIKEFIKKSLEIVLDRKKTNIRKVGEIKQLAGDKLT